MRPYLWGEVAVTMAYVCSQSLSLLTPESCHLQSPPGADLSTGQSVAQVWRDKSHSAVSRETWQVFKLVFPTYQRAEAFFFLTESDWMA